MNGFGNLTRLGFFDKNCKDYTFQTIFDNPEYVSNFTIYYTNQTIVKVYFKMAQKSIIKGGPTTYKDITVGNSVPGM